jgi:hypothetical protein
VVVIGDSDIMMVKVDLEDHRCRELQPRAGGDRSALERPDTY